MSVQFIEKSGQAEYAVIPVVEYNQLLHKAEQLDELLTFDKAVAFDEETLPHDMVCQLVAGHNKIKVWREYRGMTQAALAKQTGLDFLVISSLEIDEYQFTDELVKLIATALLIDVDDLV